MLNNDTTQNFLGRRHLESTKIRHFNLKILKKFLRRGHCPLPRSLPLCVYTMQMLQENIEGRFFGELKGEVRYYYCSAFLIYLWYLASRSVLWCLERTKFIFFTGAPYRMQVNLHGSPCIPGVFLYCFGRRKKNEI